ncbi:tripartite tricarboxylate transporter substrate binding protein [Variovorax sp. YR216]|uniref:tripartite tricarboxylate transporter substrate binding protein n=1 Tax=Variovorax sp. YR216 TaxID=1882828 RepID=UPI000898ABEA|nr:tripartite tricarboxylate transporter substrate binding protein [Variovorax sp. YR216]SEB08392.1 Tripartite-type tricarboxylate transporter, receptor component TctC [Variovorax sp. YR216]
MSNERIRAKQTARTSRGRRALFGLAVLCAAIVSLPATAQAPHYPSKPLKLIVPYPPGAATDNIARAFGQELAKVVGQPVIVENRPGGGSSLGIIAAKGQPADGYTLLVRAEGFYSAKLATPSLPYEFSDFEILAPLAQSSYAFIVAADRGWKRLDDLKNARREIDVGSLDLGVGVYSTLAARMARDLGIRYRTIPFKGGAEGLTAILAGQIDAYFTTIGTTQAVKDSPKVKVLATTGLPGGNNFLPGVKTFQELGLPNMVFSSSYSLNVRSDTPAPIKEQLSRAVQQALASEAMKTARRQLFLEPYAGSALDYRRDQARVLKEFEAAAAEDGKAAK